VRTCPTYSGQGTVRVLRLWGGLAIASALAAQPHDLLLKGGHLIDPKNQIDAPRDVAITGGRVSAVATRIAADQARTVIDVTGLYIAPGFIDLHTHVFTGLDPRNVIGGGSNSLLPDAFTLRAGVTTAVDAGSSGRRNFPAFQRHIIKRAQTRILAFLNIVGHGMSRSQQDLSDMEPDATADFIRQHPGLIVGVKTAHWSAPTWDALKLALEAGRLADVPVMVDFGMFFPQQRPFEELVGKYLRPGDIYTHVYLPSVPLLDAQGRLRPYIMEAQRRGVIFDAGHGRGSFVYRQAVPATRDGFWPNSISTDLHAGSMNRAMKDMANVMSKFLNLGLSLPEVIARSTWAPAQIIRRPDLGHLSVGAGADMAVFGLRTGKFGFYDIIGGSASGDRKIECELTLRAGQVVWDLNGISMVPWEKLPPNARPH
jgi:dihydroorotase